MARNHWFNIYRKELRHTPCYCPRAADSYMPKVPNADLGQQRDYPMECLFGDMSSLPFLFPRVPISSFNGYKIKDNFRYDKDGPEPECYERFILSFPKGDVAGTIRHDFACRLKVPGKSAINYSKDKYLSASDRTLKFAEYKKLERSLKEHLCRQLVLSVVGFITDLYKSLSGN